MTTTNPLHGEETGQTTKKLTAIRSLVVGAMKLKGLYPGVGTELKAQEVLLYPASIKRQKQPGRPNSQNDKTDGKIRPDNLIVQTDHQEIRTIKRHVWRKSCEK